MSKFAAIVVGLCLSVVAARAEEGLWMSLEADDGTKAGLVFPDYQPNNFSVFWMVCPQNGGPAELVFEFPIENLSEGIDYPVAFLVDDEAVELTGKGRKDEFQGAMVVEVKLDRDDPIFDRLANATRIVIKIGEIDFPTPIKGAWSAISNFTNLCRMR